MAKITEKILEIHAQIRDGGIKPGEAGDALAESFGQQATAAIINGKDSVEWQKFMSNFASNADQLKRLLGRDTDFNKNDWSSRSLTYIATNPMCTTTTVTGSRFVDTVEVPNRWTLNTMRQDMIEGLDKGIDNATGPEDWYDNFVAAGDTTAVVTEDAAGADNNPEVNNPN
jgi:hypothetical protein